MTCKAKEYIIKYWFRGSTAYHMHKTYATESDVSKLATNYFDIPSVRMVIVYDENGNEIAKRGA